jgi:hypothetical protein
VKHRLHIRVVTVVYFDLFTCITYTPLLPSCAALLHSYCIIGSDCHAKQQRLHMPSPEVVGHEGALNVPVYSSSPSLMSYVRYNVDDCDDTRSIAGLRGPHFHKDSCLDKE